MSGSAIAPGARIRVRDAEWLVTKVEPTKHDGELVYATGISPLVRGEEAAFFDGIEPVEPVDPSKVRLVDETSPNYRRSRLFLEAVMRRTSLPRSERGLAMADAFMMDPLRYQRRPAQLALEGLRPRLLIADIVGLGKTLEVGLILGELIRRGRGEKILVVTPQQVLTQFQRELWTRFSIPLLRMDSVGITRVQQQLPAGRNPFSHNKRIIISIDTLKNQDKYRRHLEQTQWDIVVIDESHNLVGSGSSQRKRLAELLAPRTEALIFASATPHNGDDRAFACLVSMLDPTRVTDPNRVEPEQLEGIFIRRSKTSAEVKEDLASLKKAKWAERAEPVRLDVKAAPAEEAVFDELQRTWLNRPVEGRVGRHLFQYTLLKSFLSSPAALKKTVEDRLGRGPAEERTDLERLAALNDAVERPVKFDALLDHLRRIGVGKRSTTRAVVFTERVTTLKWLSKELRDELGMSEAQVRILDGKTPDTELEDLVEEFGQATSPVRLLVTSDVASEGVNFHKACHHLIHWDLPWSLIRIEQRNGRIDRYGQEHSPEIAALLLRSQVAPGYDENRVAQVLVTKEESVHQTLGAVENGLGHSDPGVEEDRNVHFMFAEHKTIEEAVEAQLDAHDSMWADLDEGDFAFEEAAPPPAAETPSLFETTEEFVRTALAELKVEHRYTESGEIAVENLPADLKSRLAALPPEYVSSRGLMDKLLVTGDLKLAECSLELAQKEDKTAWPEVAFLSDLHPLADWLTDRALLELGRDVAPVVYCDVAEPVFCVQGTYANAARQTAVAEWMAVTGLPGRPKVDKLIPALKQAGVSSRMVNPGQPCDAIGDLQTLIPAALDCARTYLDERRADWDSQVQKVVDDQFGRVDQWVQETLEGLAGPRRADETEATAAEQRRRIESLAIDSEPHLRVLAVLYPKG